MLATGWKQASNADAPAVHGVACVGRRPEVETGVARAFVLTVVFVFVFIVLVIVLVLILIFWLRK